MSDRKQRAWLKKIKIVALVLLIAACVGTLLCVPPTHIVIIIVFIATLMLTTYLAMTIMFSKKDSILASSFVGLFLTSSLLGGFNMINIILLASFIIGIKLLLK